MESLCRGYLCVLSVYHLFTGIVSMFFPDFAMNFYRWFYRCEPADRADLFLILKPWGALAAFAGVVGLFAAVDPTRYQGVIIGLILLLLFRIYYRLAFARRLEQHANITPRRNLVSIVPIACGVAILIGWYLQSVY